MEMVMVMRCGDLFTAGWLELLAGFGLFIHPAHDELGGWYCTVVLTVRGGDFWGFAQRL
ncbi:hypothetical protein [Synechococcus sp. CBW1107]|uniref:hypothetical protein n=1 Tax=Synechococcus sp. CBW1107 TaxID=2789857 RepID=UPI002AD325B8|nr:hypothetical protein [Synechococcus sp. CBW1107]